MTESPFNEDWQKIKYLAGRLQTITSLLDFVSKKTEQIESSQELNLLEKQLVIDFDETMNNLIDLIEKHDC